MENDNDQKTPVPNGPIQPDALEKQSLLSADVGEEGHDHRRGGDLEQVGEILSFSEIREQRRLLIRPREPKPRPTAEELLALYEHHKAQQQATTHQPDVAPAVEENALSADVASVFPTQTQPTVGRQEQVRASSPVYTLGLPPPLPQPVTKPVCPLCRGAGYLRADLPFGHPDFGKPIRCKCKQEQDKARLRQAFLDLSLLGHMKRFEHATFQSFKQRLPGVKEAYQAALDFSKDPVGWLTLVGPNGCGKTHLAIAIARRCLEQGMSVLFSVTPDLLDHLRATFAPDAEEQFEDLFQKMKDVEVLLLDDLGTEQGTAFANDKLFQLVNYRYNRVLPLVVTANPQAMREMNPRIASRLASGVIVNMVGAADYRLYREPKRT